jgi:hypothetical protein
VRLWSIHPRYLDPQGLVALWREALLARAVLDGHTRGYRHHPQLARFRAQGNPPAAIAAYLREVHSEASARGYAFDARKLAGASACPAIEVTTGQLDHEWAHLCRKLAARSPGWLERWGEVATPQADPLFRAVPGPVEAWERASALS